MQGTRMDTQILREIDRRISEMDRDFALHRQALQYQIAELTKRIQSLEARKPAIGPQILEFLLSPKATKWMGGGALTIGGYLLSRLTG